MASRESGRARWFVRFNFPMPGALIYCIIVRSFTQRPCFRRISESVRGCARATFPDTLAPSRPVAIILDSILDVILCGRQVLVPAIEGATPSL
jgi:hypothetical protein